MEILREGMCSQRVEALKARLNELRYDCGNGDDFNRRTAWAVRWFCHQNGLEPAYFVDEALWTRIFAETAVPGVTETAPYYNMNDPVWADYPYDAANTPEIETISTSGCGPTSMAMAVSAALKRAVLPPVLADWSNANGFRDPDGIHGTDDSFFPACAELYGLTSELVKIEDEASFRRAADAIHAGKAIICNVVPGSPFTSCGHYNLIADVREGRVYINDPSPRNMEKPAYTVQEWLEGRWGRHYMIVGKKE